MIAELFALASSRTFASFNGRHQHFDLRTVEVRSECVPHRVREGRARRYPVHVTLRIAPKLPSMRRADTYWILRQALIAGAERDGFKLVHYSVQGNHVHLICEAADITRLSRGIQGLCVRIARTLNRWWERTGTVFADRFHSRDLRTPREVKNALVYVLQNAKHHGLDLPTDLDPFSSAEWFDGWRRVEHGPSDANAISPLARAGTWLLVDGWRRHGLLEPTQFAHKRH